VKLRSFKLRFWDEHVWIVPGEDLDGCAFGGPGVDLRGDAAREAFVLAAPILEVLRSFEPGLELRALSIDLEGERLLATTTTHTPFEQRTGERPRVIRVDRGPAFDRIREAAKPVVDRLAALAREKLEGRARR
jgi:hypothetical protein